MEKLSKLHLREDKGTQDGQINQCTQGKNTEQKHKALFSTVNSSGI